MVLHKASGVIPFLGTIVKRGDKIEFRFHLNRRDVINISLSPDTARKLVSIFLKIGKGKSIKAEREEMVKITQKVFSRLVKRYNKPKVRSKGEVNVFAVGNDDKPEGYEVDTEQGSVLNLPTERELKAIMQRAGTLNLEKAKKGLSFNPKVEGVVLQAINDLAFKPPLFKRGNTVARKQVLRYVYLRSVLKKSLGLALAIMRVEFANGVYKNSSFKPYADIKPLNSYKKSGADIKRLKRFTASDGSVGSFSAELDGLLGTRRTSDTIF